MVTLELLFSVLLSIGMWLLYAISFRKFTGMNKHLECDPGAALRESPCGTAKINALLAINGVRLIRSFQEQSDSSTRRKHVDDMVCGQDRSLGGDGHQNT